MFLDVHPTAYLPDVADTPQIVVEHGAEDIAKGAAQHGEHRVHAGSGQQGTHDGFGTERDECAGKERGKGHAKVAVVYEE